MKKSGQSIVETVIAAALISLAIVACLALVNYTQKQAAYSRNLNAATAFNNAAADWLRGQRELLGWPAVTSKLIADATGNSVTYCLNDIASSGSESFNDLTPGDCGTDTLGGTPFTREMTADISGLANGTISINITSTWQDSSSRQANFTMELSQWN